MRLPIIRITLLITALQYSLVHTKNLFMIDHNLPHSITATTEYKHKNLDMLADAFLEHLNKQVTSNTSKAAPAQQKMIIFDIDDTALTAKLKAQTSWACKEFIPIVPMLRLYKTLIAQGYKIAFVTWRIELPGFRDKTLHHLLSNGFEGFHSLHMRPKNCNVSCEEYKQSVRNTLAKEFDIVATLDDRWRNLQGSNTGECILWVCVP